MEQAMLEILAAKERRGAKQQELLQACSDTLLCLTLNIPGNRKDSPLVRLAFYRAQDAVKKALPSARVVWVNYSAAGPACFYQTALAPRAVKTVAMALESAAPIGRLWDLDVIGPKGAKLSRPTPRKCLVCEKTFLECAKEQKHTLQEVQNIVEPILKENAAAVLAQLAIDALLEEVHLTPKPGLVDENNSGAHGDMDLPLFEKSAESLRSYFEQAVRLGMANEACMKPLQRAGREAEQTMLAATGGINTHKGAVYAFGLLLAAMGSHISFGSELFSTAAMLAADGETPQEATHGAKVRVKYRNCGARAEAIEGFPNAISAYNILKETRNQYRAMLWLIASVKDTNLLYRGGADGLIYVQELAKKAQSASDDALETAILQMDESCIQHHLSPGGSADLLALAFFLLKTEEIWDD